MGFIVSTLSLCTLHSLTAIMVYLIIYVVTSINIFAIVLCFRKVGSFVKIKYLIEFSTMLKSNYMLSIIFSLVLLSLAGVPPLADFLVSFMFFQYFYSRILFNYGLFGFNEYFKLYLLY